MLHTIVGPKEEVLLRNSSKILYSKNTTDIRIRKQIQGLER